MRGKILPAAGSGPTASPGAAPSVLTSFALVSLDFSASVDPAGGGLTYSATMDVKPAGSAATLVDSTTSTPDFTPDTLGTYSGVVTVTDVNGRTDTSRWYREVRSALTASLAAISSQKTLAAIQGAATATGGIGTKTHGHTVNGVTTGLSDPAVEDPTFTPTAAGTYEWVYTVTDAAGQVAKATRTFTVGKQLANGRWSYLAALVDFAAEATASWLAEGATATTRTLGGFDFESDNANEADAFGIVNTAGVQLRGDTSAMSRITGPMLYIKLTELFPGWTYGQPFVVQVEIACPVQANGGGYVGLCLCSEIPTAITGEFVVVAGYEKSAGGVLQTFVDHTVGGSNVTSSVTATGATAYGQELVYNGSGVQAGWFSTDPAGTPPDPGSSTKTPVVAASPSDVGPVAWVTRRPGTAAESTANAYLAIVHHSNAGINLEETVKRLWGWL